MSLLIIVIAYLLGSIPTAYIAGRLKNGVDIRTLGDGNMGAGNAFHQLGPKTGFAVGTLDAVKGAIAILLAQAAGLPQFAVLLTGVAAVIGHNWPVFLNFRGGRGEATTIGILSVMMTRELLIALAITLLLMVLTHNTVLSVNISLLFSVPVSAWFLEKSWLFVGFSLIVALVLILHFLPTAKTALARAGSKEKLLAELVQSSKAKKKRR